MLKNKSRENLFIKSFVSKDLINFVLERLRVDFLIHKISL